MDHMSGQGWNVAVNGQSIEKERGIIPPFLTECYASMSSSILTTGTGADTFLNLDILI